MDDKDQLYDLISYGIFEAVGNVVERALVNWNKEVPLNTQELEVVVGGLTLTTGAMMLMDKTGKEAAAKAIRKLADRLERGDLDDISPQGSGALQ